MKRVIRLRGLLLIVIVSAAITACQKQIQKDAVSNDETLSVSEKVIVPESEFPTASSSANSAARDYNTFYGPAIQMGNGHIRSWINITREDNTPLAMGIELTGNSFQGLPDDPENFAANTFVLPLHQKAKAVTPFDHLVVNWEPHGHEPPGIYDVPHFDFHFYKITLEQQMAITPFPTAAPPAGYLPASYVIQGATVPQMGTHWLDPSSPELPPTLAPFTHTFIYGSNNGQVIFMEPMITRAFLLGGTIVNKSIPQPIHFSPVNTNYPTSYNIWKNVDNGRSYVGLSGFVWR